MYSHYKPLRNSLRQKPLISGLLAVWDHMRKMRVEGGGIRDLNSYPAPWELELLAREVILNCQGSIQDQKSYSCFFDMSKEINRIRKITSEISKEHVDNFQSATSSLHALIHQQIGWQDESPFEQLYRYIKIYGHSSLSTLVEKKLGVSVSDIYMIGMAVSGGLGSSPNILLSNYAHLPGLAPGAERAFFKFVSQDIDSFREEIRAHERYDRYWAYSYNPWRGHPLIFDKSAPEKMFGISSDFLRWKITDGIFYEICKFGDFSKAWGDAFSAYIGEVLTVILSSSESFQISPEINYSVGKGKPRKGTDWIVSDSGGHVFIECKTKRLSMQGKWGNDTESYDSELRKLAVSFGQNYQNIYEARKGLRPGFDAQGLQMINLVSTLEDWRLAIGDLESRLKKMILEDLTRRELTPTLIEEVPYFLLSAQQLEDRFQHVAVNGVVPSFLSWNEIKRIKRRPLFPNALAELMPNIAKAAGFDKFGHEYD